jgi:hypothetical protein
MVFGKSYLCKKCSILHNSIYDCKYTKPKHGMVKYLCQKCGIIHSNPNECIYVKEKQKINGKTKVKYIHNYFCISCATIHKNANDCPLVRAQKSKNRIEKSWGILYGDKDAEQKRKDQGDRARIRFTGTHQSKEQISKRVISTKRPKKENIIQKWVNLE